MEAIKAASAMLKVSLTTGSIGRRMFGRADRGHLWIESATVAAW